MPCAEDCLLSTSFFTTKLLYYEYIAIIPKLDRRSIHTQNPHEYCSKLAGIDFLCTTVLDYKYPSMDELAAAIGEICEKIHCPIVGLGEGAGANILARVALLANKQLHGAVLIHCTSTTAGFLESMQDKVLQYQFICDKCHVGLQ